MKRAWSFLSSLTLTIVLAIFICAVSAWGSVLSVRYPGFYRSIDEAVLLPRLMAGGAKELGFTLWIYALMALIFLFSLNTAACTADRVYSIVKTRAPLNSLFPHIVHVGFLVALLGHLAGSVWGFKAHGVPLFKGDTVSVPHADGLSVRLEDFDIRRSSAGEIEDLWTRVTLLEDGAEAVTDEIRINGPVIYKGVAFYHVDQGVMPRGLVLEAGREPVSLGFYSTALLKDSSRITLGEVFPDFSTGPDKKAYSLSGEFRNPHVEVVIEGEKGGREKGYLYIGSPGSSVSIGKRVVRLADYMTSPYVVVNISKDSGIWLIIAGSSILTVGMVLLLFSSKEKGEIVRGR